MAHTLSALKRMRQNEKRNEQNRGVKSRVRTQIKRVLEAVGTKDASKAKTAYQRASKLLDKAVAKGALHANNAARHKSRLARQVSALGSPKK